MVPKLVRDRVPESIIINGRIPVGMLAEPGDRGDWLRQKLHEEVDEFLKDDDPMELVDIYEVLRGLWAYYNPEADISLSQAAAIKRETLGGFYNFEILTDVREKP